MGNPVFRFILSHTPKTSVSTGITLPANSEGENVAGSGNDWSSGNAPSVTVSGSSGSRQSDIWANDYGFGTGLSYTINYSVGYSINANVIATTVFFVVLDVANNILIFDSKSIVGTGTGTLNDSSTLTAPAGSVKFGFYIQITNGISNAGSTFTINSYSGSVASAGESGSPSSVNITEPMGWKDSKLKLERHPDFHSLVEYFETGLTYYGSNGVQNGGINFLKAKEQEYGFDTTIEETVQADIDGDGVFEEEIFSGLKDLTALQEIPDNKIEVPTIRNDLWSKFISRLDTPVDLRSTTTLDGDPCSPVVSVDINLPSQTIRKQYSAESTSPGITSEDLAVIVQDTYYQMSFDDVTLDEIEEVFNLLQATNTIEPVGWLETKYAGTYSFEFQTVAYDYNPAFNFDPGEDLGDYIRFYLNINGVETEFDLGDTFTALLTIEGGRVYTLNLPNQVLPAKSVIKIYGRAIADLTESSPGYSGQIRWNGPVLGVTINHNGSFSTGNIECYARITADTTYPSSEATGFYLHDAFAGVIERIVGRNAFYSEILGRTDTNMRQYAANGCFSKNVLLRGLQIRGYSLEQKPFSISFNQLWKGANPIFNLGIGYESISGTEYLRLEDKGYFYDNDVIISISNVRQITREYDHGRIYNKIEVGYTKWQSEDISGIDDPQTKHVYATRIINIKNTLTLHSDFIAASVAIETTRRQTIEKNKDYKYDNETFIIAINDDDVSPDRYRPELSENFSSISGLIQSMTRYNSILTPMRNLLRWANVWNGCLQKYQNSFLKFVSGEGNFDMSSEYSCAAGYECLGVLCDNLSEKQDIPLGSPNNYGEVFGYLHLPDVFTIDIINFTWDAYKAIRNNRTSSIRISQTETNYKRFKIKELIYEVCKGKCRIVAWPYDEFIMSVVETSMPERSCTTFTITDICPEEFEYEAEYAAIISSARDLGFRLPSCEQRLLQNQLVIDLKAAGIWSELDVLYIFATDGDSDFATINWINPAQHRCTKQNSPTFITNIGFEGNGTDMYLDTNWIPSTHGVNFTLNDACGLCHVNNNTTETVHVFAEYGTRSGIGTAGQFILLANSAASNQHSWAINGGGAVSGTAVSADGFFHMKRTASNSQALYKNGASVGTSAQSSNSLSTRSMYILKSNEATMSNTDRQVSMFAAGASLTGSENAVYTIWNTYFTSI